MENWVIKNKKADFEQLVKQFGISEVIARCLVNKGLLEKQEIENFLHPKLSRLHHPLLMKDMQKACEILTSFINDGKKIRIIGDYDVDGVISTYILYTTLLKIGANVDYEIPDRVKDGYGMNIQMVEACYKDKVDLILTCDNGISAIDQIAKAKEYGMTVIVTDHHDLVHTDTGEILLPDADALLNPKQPDCKYPYKGLCGAGVAYKLLMALIDYITNRTTLYELHEQKASLGQKVSVVLGQSFESELLSYVAIATVCDVMELLDENRIIVKHGLNLLKNTNNYGLLALMDASNIDKEQLSTFHLGYVLGPCLNASGRLNTAKRGLELLLSDTAEKAIPLAEEVRGLNEVRKDMTALGVTMAIDQIENSSLKMDKVLVVYLKDCHESLAGIIAGRLREKYYKPAIVLTDAEDSSVKGSARSIELYNIYEELSKCRDLLLKMGGHPMAAGLSLTEANIESLRLRLNSMTTLSEEMLIPKVTIDIHLPLGFVSETLVNELKQLEPFGKGNEKPLFAEKDLQIKSAMVIGKNSSGIRFRLINSYQKEMEALYFGDVETFFTYIADLYGTEEAEKLRMGRSTKIKLMITYFPRINEYNGTKTVQILIQNYR
ncbi:MAG: hypothetical protein K0S47_2685 [Herbinix sp.]|jgi:single-stranded-DNA-specific exonuclease|nr:hypothetical protein [Herbinix sp.]